MKNIVVERQKMCYNLKIATVLQGGADGYIRSIKPVTLGR